MQLNRRTSKNLVYWPVMSQKKSSTDMVKLQSVELTDKSRWCAHMNAVAEKRDKQAFQALYLHFAPKIKAFYLTHGMTSKAEELTHEVFLRVWQKAKSYQSDKANVSTWIFTIARNIKIDLLRKKKIVEIEEESATEAAVEDNLEANVDLLRDKKMIHSIFKRLNEEQRQVMQKVYFEDKSHSVVARELNMTLGEVKSRVRSGLKVLRKHMGGEC